MGWLFYSDLLYLLSLLLGAWWRLLCSNQFLVIGFLILRLASVSWSWAVVVNLFVVWCCRSLHPHYVSLDFWFLFQICWDLQLSWLLLRRRCRVGGLGIVWMLVLVSVLVDWTQMLWPEMALNLLFSFTANCWCVGFYCVGCRSAVPHLSKPHSSLFLLFGFTPVRGCAG
jgi:hypothetical protein